MVPGRQDRRVPGALNLPLPTPRQPLCQFRLRQRQGPRPRRHLPLLPHRMRHRALDERVRARGQVAVPGAEGVAADLVT